MHNLFHLMKRSLNRNHSEKGQGLVEYALILGFAALTVFAIINVMEISIEDVFSKIVGTAPVAPPSLLSYTPPPTYTPIPTVDPAATATLPPTATDPANPPTATSEQPTLTHTPTATSTPVCTGYSEYPLPGRVQMENFRCGGSAVAFADSTGDGGPGSGIYRSDVSTEGPDLAAGNGGHYMGWFTTGEWVKYDVNVSASQLYDITFRVASNNNNGKFRLELINSGQVVHTTSSISVPDSGGSQSWTDITITDVPFVQGSNQINVVIENGGFISDYFNVAQSAPPPTATNVPTATPVPTCYTLTTAVSPTNSGTTVSVSKEPDCNNNTQYETGTEVTLTANANSAYTFSGWTGDADCSDGTVTINNDLSCTAVFISASASCTLPAPWVSSDVGNVGEEGTACEDSGTFTVEGSGEDIWNKSDEFHYVYQQYSGDFSIIAQVTSQENTNGWAKAGVMIRESLNANSKHAMAIVTPGNGIELQYRSSTGGNSGHAGNNSYKAPNWIKLERIGNIFTAYQSGNGTNWTKIASKTVTMGSTVYYGLAVTSHNDNTLSTATFTDVELVQPIKKLINADFNTGQNDFNYVDDEFGTSNANKADGIHGDYGKDGTNGLRVRLAKDSKSNNPMSGGWEHALPLSSASALSIDFDYRLQTIGMNSSQDECGQIIVEIRNSSGNAIVSEIVREQCGSSDSGWIPDSLNITQLPAGNYNFVIGAYLTKANQNAEYVYARFDNVVVETR